MLSVCIPVYNQDVRNLAGTLARQASALGIDLEICIADDGSAEQWKQANSSLSGIPGIVYIEAETNRGRAATRNLLGETASSDWLLFLDADSEVASPQFLEKYLAAAPGGLVVCGGTLYQTEPPADPRQQLRWIYGRRREQLPAAKRNKRHRPAITSNNFMIRRDVFLDIPFREQIREYGHEDTVLGFDLFTAGIPVLHIDNPVIHTGLEFSESYLQKSATALANLLAISRTLVTDARFTEGLPLLRALQILKKTGLRPLCRWLFRLLKPWLTRHLTSRRPRLLLFDLYRAGTLCALDDGNPVPGRMLPPPAINS